MTDQELNEKYWLDGVDDALTTTQALFEKKIYHHALFYCQFAAEKQLKAYITKNLDRQAPPIHDLIDLAKIAKISLTASRSEQLRTITRFNIAARYDDGDYSFKKYVNRKYALTWYKITKEIIAWLKKL